LRNLAILGRARRAPGRGLAIDAKAGADKVDAKESDAFDPWEH